MFDRQQCVWASIHVEETGWVNASVTVGKGGRTLLLSTPLVPMQNATVLGTAYGWGNIPFLNAEAAGSGLPVLLGLELIVPYERRGSTSITR